MEYVMNNTNKRQAHAIVRELSNILGAVPVEALPYVARGLADTYALPRKVMLREMARYTRLYR